MDKHAHERSLLVLALGFAWQLGYTIVMPLLIFGIGGRALDRYFDTSPIMFLVGLVISVLVTVAWMTVRLSVFTKDISDSDETHSHDHDAV